MLHHPRRILMTVDAVGGVWRYAVDAARGLNARGVSVVLAGLGPEPSAAQRAEVRALPGTDIVWLDAPLDWLAAAETDLDRLPPILARLVDELCIDLVQLNVPSQAAGLRLPVPVVAVSHSCVVTWWDAVRAGPLPTDWAWQRARTRRGLDAAAVVITPSRSHGAAVVRAYGPVTHLRVVPNAGTPVPIARDKDPVVFAAGRWWDEGKNGRLLDAAARRISWPVEMAGAFRGPNGQEIRLANAAALGELSSDEVRRRMARAAIVACPSLYEPFGLVALEAAHAGAALVLADIPTFRELWSGAAVFADPRDPEAFAAAVERLAADADLRARMGESARARAARFNLDAQVDGLLDAYAAAAGPRAGARLAAE
jgi:glycosyltransferase involved in cell wall biosynthesis